MWFLFYTNVHFVCTDMLLGVMMCSDTKWDSHWPSGAFLKISDYVIQKLHRLVKYHQTKNGQVYTNNFTTLNMKFSVEMRDAATLSTVHLIFVTNHGRISCLDIMEH